MPTDANEELAKQLEATGDYRVLRRLVPYPANLRPGGCARIGVAIDVETTGLDVARDEVIELAMVKFAYSADDRVLGVVDVFQAFQQPSHPIAPEIVELTGITDAMVESKIIDAEAVVRFVENAQIITAHNASFDRRIAERFWPTFVHKPWACTATGVAWKEHGFSGAKLEHLLARCSLFYDAHRATDDCDALVALLSQTLPRASATVLSVLLARASQDRKDLGAAISLRAEGFPEKAQLPLERRRRRPSEVLVSGHRRGGTGGRVTLPQNRDLPARHRHRAAGIHCAGSIFGP